LADVEKGLNPEDFGWAAPTKNVDGSDITSLLNYNVYRADDEASLSTALGPFYTVVGTLQTDGTYRAPLDQFPGGRHVIALTAVDAEGDESSFSNTLGFEVSEVGVPPSPPVLSA
jgi:hypothetical protein